MIGPMITSIQNTAPVTYQESKQIEMDVKTFNPSMKVKNKLSLYTGLSILDKNELEILVLMLKQAQQQKNNLPVELVQKFVFTNGHYRSLKEKRKILFEKTVSTLKKIASINFSLLFEQDERTDLFSYVPSMFNIVNVYKEKETNGLSKIEFIFNDSFWSLIDPNFITNCENYMHFNIKHLSELCSKYAQRLYLLCSTYRYSEYKGLTGKEEGTGQVVIQLSLETSSANMPSLRDFLSIPKTYKTSSFKTQIVEPAIKQLKKLNDFEDICKYRNELKEKGYSEEKIESTIEEEKSKGHFAMFMDLNAKFLTKTRSKGYGGVAFSFVYKDPQLSFTERFRIWSERNRMAKKQKVGLVDQQGLPHAETPNEARQKKIIKQQKAEIERLRKQLESRQKVYEQYDKQNQRESVTQDQPVTKSLGENNIPNGYIPPIAESTKL